MSRIRSIHPGLWTDEAFVGLSAMARLFLMGLWNECDDMGSFSWSPLGLKMRILPADSVDANELLAEIQSAGIVMRYEMSGKAYGAVRNFCQYQRPKKPNSSYPQTEEVEKWVNIEARQKRDGSEDVGNQLPTGGEKPRQMEDGGGEDKEGCSDEQPKARKRASDFELPDWVPDEPWSAFVEMRKAIPKVPFTVRAAREIIGDLDRLRGEGHDPGKVLLLAVKRGWRGVFGDHTTTGVVAIRPPTEMDPDQLRNAIRFRRDIGDEDKAAEYEAELAKRLAA
jgi:hypothetical protein